MTIVYVGMDWLVGLAAGALAAGPLRSWLAISLGALTAGRYPHIRIHSLSQILSLEMAPRLRPQNPSLQHSSVAAWPLRKSRSDMNIVLIHV